MVHTIKHKISAVTKAWIQKEIKIQKALHKQISKDMNVTLAPKRAKWYAAFFDRIQRPDRGFNVHYTNRRVIPDAEIPQKPAGRKDKVVW